MNPIEDAWSALKAAGRYGPVGGSKTAPTYSGGPGSWSFPAHKDPTERITGKRRDTGGGGWGPSIVPAVGGAPEGITQAIHGMGGPEPEPESEPEPLRSPPQEGQYRPDAEDAMWGQLLQQWLAGKRNGR